MNNLLKFLFGFGKEEKYVPPKSYSEKSGDTLTQYEKYVLLDTGRCPDCSGQLGLHDAGAGIQCRCLRCGAEFNCTPPMGPKSKNKKESVPIIAHRTNNRRAAAPKEEPALP